jgi:hypothetical protein
VRVLSRLLTQLVLRLLLTVAFGALVLAMQGRLPLTAAVPGGPSGDAPTGAVDPQAEAGRVARMLRDLAAGLRGGSVYDAGATPVGGGPAGVAPASAPRFTAVPGVSAPRQSADPEGPRILNGGGAGSFHRVPAP